MNSRYRIGVSGVGVRWRSGIEVKALRKRDWDVLVSVGLYIFIIVIILILIFNR